MARRGLIQGPRPCDPLQQVRGTQLKHLASKGAKRGDAGYYKRKVSPTASSVGPKKGRVAKKEQETPQAHTSTPHTPPAPCREAEHL